MTQDELFMRRALELARTGLGSVRPNPCVGCVIVSDGQIIGEGWHRAYGGPHAEVNAIASVAEPLQLRDSTVYVTLEPCSHFGKTPPCADLLIRHGVGKVIIATMDTNPLVGGAGILKLKKAGIEVVTGVLEAEAREINKRFFTLVEKRRPYIILKWAQTADRFIARTDFSSKWISNEYSRQLVHRWRSEEAAVMVGTSTAEHDNPELSVRDWTGLNPIRVVPDRYQRLDASLRLFDHRQPTLCYTLSRSEEQENLTFVRLQDENFFPLIVNDLYERGIQSVLVEGGKHALNFFIKSGMWDEARVFSSRQSFGDGIEAPTFRGNLLSRTEVMSDTLEIYTPGKNG